MNVGNLIQWIIALAICYFSFVVLQQHFTEGKAWGASIKEAGKHIGIGLLIAVANPIAYLILFVIAAFLVLSVGGAF